MAGKWWRNRCQPGRCYLLISIVSIMSFFSTVPGNGGNKELSAAVKAGALLVDVRTPAEFMMGSVKGAINIPLVTLPGQLDQFRNHQMIVVFCQSGGRSAQAKMFLEQNGFRNVLNGGPWQNVNCIVNE